MELSTQAEETAGDSLPGKLENITRLFISGIDGISMQHLGDPDEGRSRNLVRLMARSLAAALERPAGAAGAAGEKPGRIPHACAGYLRSIIALCVRL